ncbi:Calcium-binding EF-hand family protein [Striga hermonthica]|uniref:Calcium-binding EF-hand family protein n=1 Tax=Striga hermonthica TaxID=68872 RepID=A0A9N7N220_STRHE|nr:Calcium-binding EF-hand family protein [Striga hermonthica]
MSVEIVDGPTVAAFVDDDSGAFEKWAAEKFQALDADGDGVLSRADLERGTQAEFELQSRDEIAGIYDVLFAEFDADRSGTIDPAEFLALAREVTLAKARGIGNSPVCVILQEDSLLMRAVQRARNP